MSVLRDTEFRGKVSLDLLDQFDAALAGHGHVEQHDIKLLAADFVGSVRNFVCPKSRLNFTVSSC